MPAETVVSYLFPPSLTDRERVPWWIICWGEDEAFCKTYEEAKRFVRDERKVLREAGVASELVDVEDLVNAP